MITIFARHLTIGGMAAALVALFLIGGERAAAQSLAPPPPINKRVDALELKTNYYRKKNKKFHVVRSRGGVTVDGVASPKAIICRQGFLRITFNPQLQFGGISYAWLKFTAKFPANAKGMDVSLFRVDKSGGGCGVSKLVGASPVSGKTFCSFDVEKDDVFAVEFSATDNNSDDVNTCSMEPDVVLKLTNIEIVEPE